MIIITMNYMREPVHLTDVSHHYGNIQSLDHITLSLPPASTTALTGGNGSGKSTVLGLLAGTLRPSAGTVSNTPVNVGLVPQHSAVPDLFPVTVRSVVSMGRWRTDRWRLMRPLSPRDRAIVEKSLERMNIIDLADRTLGDLSGGQRQRTLIAQGLAQEAPLLLLDEPLSAVDSHTVTLIDRAVHEEKVAGTSVVIATHHRSQAESADQIINLDRGRIAA